MPQTFIGEASTSPDGFEQKTDMEYEQYRKAEHQNFVYKNEHVILTTQAGCGAILDDAIAHLTKNFIDMPIIHTYHALGDSMRPMHKTVPLKDGRIIVTGPKSSGMVAQVHDMLNAHFNAPKPKQTQIVLPIVNRPNSQNSKSEKEPQQSVKVSKSSSPPMDVMDCGTSFHVQDVSKGNTSFKNMKNSQPSAPSNRDQKRPTCPAVNKALFSRAITDLHTQRRSHVTPPKSLQNVGKSVNISASSEARSSQKSGEKLKGMEDEVISGKNMCKSLGVGTDCSSTTNTKLCGKNQSNVATCTPDIEDKLDGQRDVLGDKPVAAQSAQPTSTPAEISSSAVEDDPAILYVANTQDQSTTTACPPQADGECEKKDMATDTVQVYDREVLLELSLCPHAKCYPLSLIIATDCEILISPSMVTDQELFHPSKHRLPMAELALSNVYMPSYNNGGRRPIELAGRKYSSDPRSWGDSSSQKRLRKPLSGQSPDLLYSESAYNCMESAPEHASYCPEFDEVFKNNAKVVPGVAFTKRPRESQDDQLVQELLAYYEPQNN